MDQAQLVALAIQTAHAYQLDPRVVCAVCEQESSWNPYAIRFEPGFLKKYVEPLNLPSQTDAMARSTSWGIMQVMGQVAREFGFKGQYLTMLCDPTAGLDIGCKVLRSKLAGHPQSLASGLLAWNGGGSASYPGEVLTKMEKY